MESSITRCNQMKFVGLKTIIRVSATSANEMNKIPSLWQELTRLAGELPQRAGKERYALITGDLPEGRQDQAHYYALLAVSDFNKIPKTLITYELPEGKIAKFLHKGKPETIAVTAAKVFTEWLPQSKSSISENMELFIYPPDYDRNNPHGSFEYCLFIK